MEKGECALQITLYITPLWTVFAVLKSKYIATIMSPGISAQNLYICQMAKSVVPADMGSHEWAVMGLES